MYKIVGDPGDYQVLECFGNYRLSKKHFKTIEQAQQHIDKLSNK